MSRNEGSVHAAAKRKLARWLKAAAAGGMWGLPSGCSVRTEYPLALDRAGTRPICWHDEPEFARRTPGNRELANNGIVAPYRLDLALVQPGAIVAGFEVMGSHPCEPAKTWLLGRMPFRTVEIDAEWVVGQRTMPEAWDAGIIAPYGAST
jgi:hypothetical protein